MRILDFLFSVVEKFSPMSTTDRVELRDDAARDYQQIKDTILDKDKTKPPKIEPVKMDIKQKVVYYSEAWYVRLGLALAFIWVVRAIQDFMNPKKDDDDDDDDDLNS